MITGYQGFFNPSQSVSIAAGESVSSAFACGGFILTGMILPSLFTGSSISFLVGDTIDGYRATGEVSLDTNPEDGDTLEINSTVITLVTGTPGALEVKIGTLVTDTAANLQAFLSASTDSGLSACTYSTVGTLLTVTAKDPGVGGNAFTFAAVSTHITLTPNGGTLAGGGFRPLYDASNSAVSMTVSEGRAYAVDPKNFQGVPFLQLQSGSTETSARTVICSLRGF